ncbi:MAG TPA: GGDEF domain-containing protein, partial [Herpetosiphonaceae bacterium]
MIDRAPESATARPGRDPLTGAYSRALLEARLREELERSERYGQPLALCMIDLDYLKNVNDAYGHRRGDDVLRELARRIDGLSRDADALFRYGGDEFILLLPNTDGQQALALARRLLAAVRDEPIAGAPPLHVSVSIGIASCPADTREPDALFAIADARQYAAKRLGRGAIVSGDQADQTGP